MVWVYLALAFILLFCLFFHFLRLQFSLNWSSPSQFSGEFQVSCLGFLLWREFLLSDKEIKESPLSAPGEIAITQHVKPGSGQAGFLGVPFTVQRKITGFRKHIRKAAIKFALDPRVWRTLLAFLFRSGFRALRLLHLRLENMHIGFEDVLLMGRFAAIWSIFTGLVPEMDCPVYYGFNEKKASFKLGMVGVFSGLNLLLFGFVTALTFPWISIARRFRISWRSPELNRWQRRLLLF